MYILFKMMVFGEINTELTPTLRAGGRFGRKIVAGFGRSARRLILEVRMSYL